MLCSVSHTGFPQLLKSPEIGRVAGARTSAVDAERSPETTSDSGRTSSLDTVQCVCVCVCVFEFITELFLPETMCDVSVPAGMDFNISLCT